MQKEWPRNSEKEAGEEEKAPGWRRKNHQRHHSTENSVEHWEGHGYGCTMPETRQEMRYVGRRRERFLLGASRNMDTWQTCRYWHFLFLTTFIQLLNWDWSTNRPREETGQENAWDPGWYSNAASILRPPLLDPSVPAPELAKWIDNNTIAIHHLLLPHIDQIIKSDDTSFAFSLPRNNT